MSDPGTIDRWLNVIKDVLVPAGALTALLFYFGYASTRAEYQYFGVDIGAVGLGTNDFLVRSPHPLLVPVLLIAVLAGLGVWLHLALRRLLEKPDDPRATRLLVIRRLSAAVAWIGAGLGLCGIVLMLIYPLLSDWPVYDLVTPLCLMTGIVMFAYGQHLRTQTAQAIEGPPTDDRAKRLLGVLAAAAVVGCVFWVTATLADWSGRGLGITLSEHFSDLPSVILDTEEPLQWHSAGIEESALPAVSGQTYRYRYRHLRLLIEGGGRMFLVPDQWRPSDTTFLVPLDDTVRVQFQFQNPS